MIYYFSGTGNSQWVAERMAALLGIQAVNIAGLPASLPLPEGEALGLVFPVYAWAEPEVVARFVKLLPKTEQFSFAVCTCGGNIGNTMERLGKQLRLDSAYSLVMPNNFIRGFAVDSEAEVRQTIAAAKTQIARMCEDIQEKRPCFAVEKGSLPGLKSSVVAWGFNTFARSAKPFRVTNDCNGCGSCAKACPAKIIGMDEKKQPHWGRGCYQCLSCINRCPQQAIEYGKETRGRGRYYFREEYTK